MRTCRIIIPHDATVSSTASSNTPDDAPAGLAFIRRKHWRRFLRQYWRHRQTRCGGQETTSIESHDWSLKPDILRSFPLRHENGSGEPAMRQEFERNVCLDWS
jgi:hypothetical protein